MGREHIPDSTKADLLIASDLRCSICGKELQGKYHADHINPASRGGSSHPSNLQALCPQCNLSKGDTEPEPSYSSRPPLKALPQDTPRDWQRRFYEKLDQHSKQTFTLEACPGAGKSRASMRAAAIMMHKLGARQLICVVPTVQIKRQMRDEAKQQGLVLYSEVPNRNATLSQQGHGVCVTYQQLAMNPALWGKIIGSEKTVVVLDEVHHAGDRKEWGEALQLALEPASFILCLTGTPFRSDRTRIPFVTYDAKGECQPDFSYGYSQGLRDKVVRPLQFISHSGDVEYALGDDELSLFSAPFKTDFDEVLTDPRAQAARLRAAVTPSEGEEGFLEDMLREANQQLQQMRNIKPGSAGLVLAYGEQEARDIYAFLTDTLKVSAELIISQDEGAGKRLREFKESDCEWIVAIRMVSEGVDIPRLGVLVYATNIRMELFFRQAMGRVVRATRQDPRGFRAKVFMPADPNLLAMARTVEQEIRQAAEEGEAESQPVADLDRPGRQAVNLVVLGGEVTEQGIVYQGEEFTQEAYQEMQDTLVAAGVMVDEELVLQALLTERVGSRPQDIHPEDLNKTLRGELNQTQKYLAYIYLFLRPNWQYEDAIKEIHLETRQIMHLGRGLKYEQASPEQLQEAIKSLNRTIKLLSDRYGTDPDFPRRDKG